MQAGGHVCSASCARLRLWQNLANPSQTYRRPAKCPRRGGAMAAARSKLLRAATQLSRLGMHDGPPRQLCSLADALGAPGALPAPSLQRPFSSEHSEHVRVRHRSMWSAPEVHHCWVGSGSCRRLPPPPPAQQVARLPPSFCGRHCRPVQQVGTKERQGTAGRSPHPAWQGTCRTATCLCRPPGKIRWALLCVRHSLLVGMHRTAHAWQLRVNAWAVERCIHAPGASGMHDVLLPRCTCAVCAH